ncbi:hypothetical protein AVEN_217264-1 [Araneus ventricosus]|uniref:Uncharacterized protein n=1 Tax=Araneus ventricosus TaxID=182803 RepID=A0A4Y2TQ86_ARAVE|nr:hypothetical protein AVEN_217264-1 [Araneus ventricosus]
MALNVCFSKKILVVFSSEIVSDSSEQRQWSELPSLPLKKVVRGDIFLLAPLKPGNLERKRHELDSPNMGGHLPHTPLPAITFR